MSNLDNWEKVTVKKDEVNVTTYVDTIKKYWKAISIIGMGIYLAMSAFINYIDTNPPFPEKVVVVQPESPDNRSFNDAVRRNEIKEVPQHNQLLSKFSSRGVQAELVLPSSVDVYKLVKIKTDKTASFYDVLVMSVYKGNIIFVDTVPTANKGEWVFTGPPGQYAVRLSAYDPTNGVMVETGNIIIGDPTPPPPPTPTKVTVPNVIGFTASQAEVSIKAVNLVPGLSGDLTGKVVNQLPVGGTIVDTNTVVAVSLSVAPIPPPSPPVFTEKYGFSTFSYTEVLTKVDADARALYKDKLASNFEAVAAKIAAGAYSGVSNPIQSSQADLAAMNRMTLNNNDPATVAKWIAFYTDWAAKATAQNNNPTNPLPNLVSEYGVVYKESAAGLRAAQ